MLGIAEYQNMPWRYIECAVFLTVSTLSIRSKPQSSAAAPSNVSRA